MTGALASLLVLLLVYAAGAAPTAPVSVEVRAGRLSVRSEGAPLRAILDRVAAATGVVIHSAEPLDEPTSIELRDMPIDEALRRLLRSRNTLIVYGQEGAPSAVYVLADRGGSAPPVPESGRPAQPMAESELLEASTPSLPGGRNQTPPMSESELLEARARVDAEITATLPDSRERLDALEEEFQLQLADGSHDVATWLESLLADPHPGVRVMVLQHLAQRGRVDLVMLAGALKDPDLLVQQGALEILVSRGASGPMVDSVRQAASVEDEAVVRQVLMEAIGP